MSYSIFFCIEAIGREVTSEKPESCADADTYLDLFAALKQDGDFFGLIDSNSVCLQVMYERDKEGCLIEIPRPDLGGSYGHSYNMEQSVKILQNLPSTFPPNGLEGFEFTSW